MQDAAHTALSVWESFYVIVGSAAAALTGLQFVVIVLASEKNVGSPQTTSAFGTPTIVHFCSVLLIAAILTAPWYSLKSAALCIDAFGVAGVAYVINVIRQARRQTGYKPELEDWIWHGALPLFAYVALLTAAIVLPLHPSASLFVIGANAVLLLFVGIHNAWDSVTYIAQTREREAEETDQSN
jgi:hypothetical protein